MHLIAALLIAALLSCQAGAASLPQTVRDELRRANIPLANVGIVVQRMDSASPLLSHNAARAMNPASTMKLLTTIAALDTLGPAYRWKTEVFLDGKLEDGVLEGNLIFKGYGDPKLTIEDFWLWLRELRQRGLRDIRGDIVLDHSYFDLPAYDPSDFDDDPTRAYNVGPNALLLNFNALRLRLVPNDHDADVLLEPELSGYAIRNRVTTAAKAPCRGGDNYVARLEQHDIVLEGKVPADCGEMDDYFSLLPHGDYFFAVFSALWKEMGGTINGKMREGKLAGNSAPFSTHLSSPLSEVIRDINKFSNNLMARQVFLTLGAPIDFTTTTTDANHEAIAPEDTQVASNDSRNAPSPSDPSAAPARSTPKVGNPPPSSDWAELTPPVGAPLLTPVKGTPPDARPSGGHGAGSDPSAAPARSTPKVGHPPPSSAAPARSTPVGAPLLTPVKGTPPDARPSGGHGAGSDPSAASIDRSDVAIKRWLKAEHLNFPELVMENGSGLSRIARISPQHLAALLQHAANSRYASELEASLPILGIDGTLKRRFKEDELAGYAHIKTGMLAGVKSIAGYVKARSGARWIVVFLINDRRAAAGQPAQDALIQWVQKYH